MEVFILVKGLNILWSQSVHSYIHHNNLNGTVCPRWGLVDEFTEHIFYSKWTSEHIHMKHWLIYSGKSLCRIISWETKYRGQPLDIQDKQTIRKLYQGWTTHDAESIHPLGTNIMRRPWQICASVCSLLHHLALSFSMFSVFYRFGL